MWVFGVLLKQVFTQLRSFVFILYITSDIVSTSYFSFLSLESIVWHKYIVQGTAIRRNPHNSSRWVFLITNRVELQTRPLSKRYVRIKTQKITWFQDSDEKQMRNALFCVVTQRVVVIHYRRSGTTYRSQHQRIKDEFLDFCCPEMSIRNYHYYLRNSPEECSSHKKICFLYHASSGRPYCTPVLKRPNFLNRAPTRTEDALRLMSAPIGRFWQQTVICPVSLWTLVVQLHPLNWTRAQAVRRFNPTNSLCTCSVQRI